MPNRESALDIYAESVNSGGIDQPIKHSLVVECKQNDPEYGDWVFTERQFGLVHFVCRGVRLHSKADSAPDFLNQRWTFEDVALCDGGQEIKRPRDKPREKLEGAPESAPVKISSERIQKACNQLVIASTHLILEKFELAELGKWDGYHEELWFFPVLVTTAHLQSICYDPQDIDPATGTLRRDSIRCTSRKWLIHEYPIPRSLQRPIFPIAMRSEPLQAIAKGFVRQAGSLPMFVVRSTALGEFLTMIANI